MQRSTLGSRRQGRHSSGKTNGLLDDDMVVDQDHISDYEENGAQDDGDQDMSDDDDDEDPFAQQRMPEQHPAIRTTVQLMGMPGLYVSKDSNISADKCSRVDGWGPSLSRLEPSLPT